MRGLLHFPSRISLKSSCFTSSYRGGADPTERRVFLTVLAVVPNAREVGLAVLDLGGLVHHAVIGIRKHRTPEGQEAKFRHDVRRIWEEHPAISHLAIALPHKTQQKNPLLNAERAWLLQEAEHRDVHVALHELDDARLWCAGDRVQPTTRKVAQVLAEEFPILQKVAPGPKDRLDSCRFRYWAQAFSAVALAKYELERTVAGL